MSRARSPQSLGGSAVVLSLYVPKRITRRS